MSKTAAEQSEANKILSVTGGAAAGVMGGGELGENIAGMLGANGGVRIAAGGLGGVAGGLAGGYGANMLAKNGGEVTRRLLGALGGATIGMVAGDSIGSAIDGDKWYSGNADEVGRVTGGIGGAVAGAMAPVDKDESAEQKVAEIIGALEPDELRALVDTPYSREDSKMAMTIGFCEKLAEFGLTPSDMNAMMTKRALLDGVEGTVSTASKAIGMGTLATVIAAAVAGNLTGKAHHSMEQRLNKMEDSENVRLREKAIRLATQRDELAEDLASRPVAPQPPARKQPSKGGQDIVQLLD